ncbi:MAG: dTMP kinase, partial [Bacteroidota bacterium]
MSRPLFIAFEGIDGSGKSTQVALLAEHLESIGHRVYCTAEPTTRPIGKMIREIFAGKQEADHKVIAALFAADRLDHLLNSEDGILKKMEEGFTVLSDRYFLSSYAYHSVHMPMDWVIEANRMAKDILKPDVHIFIDAEPEVCMERIRKNRTSTELY